MTARRAFAFLCACVCCDGSAAADLRGFVSEGGVGVLQYQPCIGGVISQQLFPIDDKTPNSSLREGVGAVRQIMLHRYRPLYVEMRGERGKTNTTVYQFQRAVGTVESCKTCRAILRRTFACLRRARDRLGGLSLPTPRQCSNCPTKCP